MSVLEVNNVSIRYMTGDFKEIGLKEYVLRRLKGNYQVNEFWADKEINFTLERGDMLGIIGTNGAGKSTLLKVITGIMDPTIGWVKRNGDVAALLELGSGFDGELTIRENTYLRGAILGYTRKFMDETYDRIIDFAELRDFEDRPFKQLSSGMKSRLAFSIASLVQPDILILDEVLAVGDGAFRAKSEAKMREIIAGGATTILVSHSIDQVLKMCNKVLWLHKGEQIAFSDDVKGICARYNAFLAGDQTKLHELEGIECADQNGELPEPKTNINGEGMHVQKISIFGSCMSRDVLRLFPDEQIELCSYIARQSVISAVSNPVSLEKDSIQLESEFQKRMVLWDFRKGTFDLLKNDGSEWLIIDLIDERFALAVIGDSFVTCSAEACQGAVIPKKARLVRPTLSGSDYYINGVCIREYISLFCKKLLEIYRPDHIIIHRALSAKYWKDSEGTAHMYKTGENGTDQRVNALLSYMYSVILEKISLARIIDCTDNFYGGENHIWGLASVHYEDGYYEEVSKKLKEICCPIKCFDIIGYDMKIENGVLYFSLDIETTEPLTYSFYVQKDRKYIFNQWYSDRKYILYPISDPGEYGIQYFVRRRDGGITVGQSELIILEDNNFLKK